MWNESGDRCHFRSSRPAGGSDPNGVRKKGQTPDSHLATEGTGPWFAASGDDRVVGRIYRDIHGRSGPQRTPRLSPCSVTTASASAHARDRAERHAPPAKRDSRRTLF